MKVNFHEFADDSKLKFAVIASIHNEKWVWCKHRERDTYEIPGGHREPGENIDDTAKRELYEETGAVEFDITPVCVYSVSDGCTENFGMLYFANIKKFEDALHSEIERIDFFDTAPQNLTYPHIQPFLFKKVTEFIG